MHPNHFLTPPILLHLSKSSPSIHPNLLPHSSLSRFTNLNTLTHSTNHLPEIPQPSSIILIPFSNSYQSLPDSSQLTSHTSHPYSLILKHFLNIPKPQFTASCFNCLSPNHFQLNPSFTYHIPIHSSQHPSLIISTPSLTHTNLSQLATFPALSNVHYKLLQCLTLLNPTKKEVNHTVHLNLTP